MSRSIGRTSLIRIATHRRIDRRNSSVVVVVQIGSEPVEPMCRAENWRHRCVRDCNEFQVDVRCRRWISPLDCCSAVCKAMMYQLPRRLIPYTPQTERWTLRSNGSTCNRSYVQQGLKVCSALRFRYKRTEIAVLIAASLLGSSQTALKAKQTDAPSAIPNGEVGSCGNSSTKVS